MKVYLTNFFVLFLGGINITGYHIESKIKGEEDEWQLWETVDTNRTKASIKGIQKGKEYQFR